MRVKLAICSVVVAYFVFRATVVFSTIGIFSAINMLAIAFFLVNFILSERDEVLKYGSAVCLAIGFFSLIIEVYPVYIENAGLYFEGVQTRIFTNYYGGYEDKVMDACIKYTVIDKMLLVLDSIKVVYFDVLMSAADTLHSHLNPLPKNQCFESIGTLIEHYPETKRYFSSDILKRVAQGKFTYMPMFKGFVT